MIVFSITDLGLGYFSYRSESINDHWMITVNGHVADYLIWLSMFGAPNSVLEPQPECAGHMMCTQGHLADHLIFCHPK